MNNQRDPIQAISLLRGNPDIQGTGLGLTIVNGNVEAHGGTISFESVTERGITFTVRLPIASNLAQQNS